jgi:oligopeptide/dipeptide ABC transporter ATP-binding protein
VSPLLEVRSLAVSATTASGRRAILDDVSFSVEHGEALGIVGESGSGKSMTLRAIGRILPPRCHMTGSVVFDGVDVGRASEQALTAMRRSGFSYVFQDPRSAANPLHTVGRFLMEGTHRQSGISATESRAKAVSTLESVGLRNGTQVMRAYPHELSGGMLQRVAMCAALMAGSRLLLADEPTTALDVTTQSEVLAILEDLRRDTGLAMIFVTHDLDLAAAVCDRVAVMYAGRIVEVLPAADVHLRARHPYTEALFRSRPTMVGDPDAIRPIPGRAISAYEVTTACPFAPRCEHADDRCRTVEPVWAESAGAGIACHNPLTDARPRPSTEVSRG